LQGQRSLSKAIGQASCTAEGNNNNIKLLQVQEQVGHISGQQEEHQNECPTFITNPLANASGPVQEVRPGSDVTHASLQVFLQRAWSIAQPWEQCILSASRGK